VISAGFPTRVYYLNMGGFDTHAGKMARNEDVDVRGRRLEGFQKDLKRIGRQQDVA